MENLAELWQRHGHGYHTLRATTAAQQAALLKVRSAGLGLLMAASDGNAPAGGVRRGHRCRAGAAAGVHQLGSPPCSTATG